MKIKIKNLYLALKDQGPLTRFLRNLRKGHVLGLFHKRSHLRGDGIAKVSYGSKASAIKAAEKMLKKNGTYYSNYKCIYCSKCHLGRNRENK